MILLALIELVVLIIAIERGVAASQSTQDHGLAAPFASPSTHGDVSTSKERLTSLIHTGIALAAFSLFALFAITAYYSLGGLLMWLSGQLDVVDADHTAHKQMKLAPTTGVISSSGFLMKILNIAVGALGLVAVSVAAAAFSGAVMMADTLTWTSVAEKESLTMAAGSAGALSAVSLVLKLCEALLGHVWAINLSNKRDHATRLRDTAIVAHLKHDGISYTHA